MATRETDGARWERHEKALPPSLRASRDFARLAASRACTPLTKLEEKERLLAVY